MDMVKYLITGLELAVLLVVDVTIFLFLSMFWRVKFVLVCGATRLELSMVESCSYFSHYNFTPT